MPYPKKILCLTLFCCFHHRSSVDLAIARTDNQVDMRYLINMEYSADLPINSMGRRVRSRLYFTSESHLHSMLNVLRFPSIIPSPLSLKGQEILANASELCYLTQVVMRLFEDTQKPSEDPRRFRVEILFSPGKFPGIKYHQLVLFISPLLSLGSNLNYSDTFRSEGVRVIKLL